jgi:hypothetical protein
MKRVVPTSVRRTLAALLPVITTDEVEELGLTEAVLDEFELSLGVAPAPLRLGVAVGATFFEWSAALVKGKRFSALPLPVRERWFALWWRSNFPVFRQFAKGVKSLLALAYWDHPTVRARLEYHPEQWIAEVAARRIVSYAADVRQHDRLVTEPAPLLPAVRLLRKVSHG